MRSLHEMMQHLVLIARERGGGAGEGSGEGVCGRGIIVQQIVSNIHTIAPLCFFFSFKEFKYRLKKAGSRFTEAWQRAE